MPTISVIMSIYKEQELGIRRAIDSLLSQTFSDFEFIIIVDNPHNTKAIEILESYCKVDARIHFIVHEKNKGLPAGLNAGIRMAKGEFIARQDTEDISLPNRFAEQLKYIKNHPEVDVLGTAIKYVDANGKHIMLRKYQPIVGREINKHNPVAHPTLLIRKSAFEKFGYYDETLFCEDYDLWINWYLKGVIFHNLQESYYDYYQDNDYKIRKAKPELKDTIECISKYTSKLKFNFSDYTYLYLQKAVVLLPSAYIVSLFYMYNKYKMDSEK